MDKRTHRRAIADARSQVYARLATRGRRRKCTTQVLAGFAITLLGAVAVKFCGWPGIGILLAAYAIGHATGREVFRR